MLRHSPTAIITLVLWTSLLRREPHHVVITSVPRLVSAAYGPPLPRVRGLALTHLLSNLGLRIPLRQLHIYSLYRRFGPSCSQREDTVVRRTPTNGISRKFAFLEHASNQISGSSSCRDLHVSTPSAKHPPLIMHDTHVPPQPDRESLRLSIFTISLLVLQANTTTLRMVQNGEICSIVCSSVHGPCFCLKV